MARTPIPERHLIWKDALHGASLAMDADRYMKDQFPAEAGIQIHPVITACGGSVNTIPEEVVMESYIRANTLGGSPGGQ